MARTEVPEASYGFEDAKARLKFMFIPNLTAYFLIIFLTIIFFTETELTIAIAYSMMLAFPAALVDIFFRLKRTKDVYRALKKFVKRVPWRIASWAFIGTANPLLTAELDIGIMLIAQHRSLWLIKGGSRLGKPEKFKRKMQMRVMFEKSSMRIEIGKTAGRELGLVGCVLPAGYVESGSGYIEVPSPRERVVERFKDVSMVEIYGLSKPFYLLSDKCVKIVLSKARQFLSPSS